MHPMLNIAIRAARNAGKVIVKGYENLETVEVEEKSLNDYVSSVDKEAELAIIGTLRKSYPDHSILAEESGIDEGKDKDHQWIIDPLDGTTNFIHGHQYYSITIARGHVGGGGHITIVAGGVYNPVTDELFITGQENWFKGFRRNFLLKNMRSTKNTTISVLGQSDLVVEYWPENTPTSRFIQHEDLLEISISRAQRLYNDKIWPNPVVVKLTNIEFITK